MPDSDTQPALWPLTDEAVDGVRSILARLEQVDDAIGGWSSKSQARTTGLSLYLTFEKRTDVMMALTVQTVLEKAPALLADACRRLLSAHEAAGSGVST